MSGFARVGGGSFEPTFEAQRAIAIEQVSKEAAAIYSLAAVSAICLLSSFAFARSLPAWAKTTLLGVATGGSAIVAIGSKRSEYKHKIPEAYQKLNQDLFEQGVKHQFDYTHAKLHIEATQRKIALISQLPEHLQYPVALQHKLGDYFYPVQAETLPAASEATAVSLPYSDQVVDAQNWDQMAIESVIPQFRDHAKEIAELDGHVGLVSKTRSGKTTLLIATILYAQQLGHEIYLIDGKGDDRLRSIPGIHYLQCNTPSKVDAAFAMLKEVLKELEERQDAGGVIDRPISFFVDENNLIRDSVADSREKKAEGTARQQDYDRSLKRILLQGAAAKIYLRAASHTSRVEDWGWNSGVLDSLSFMAIARNGSYESIEDLIRHQLTGKFGEQCKEQLNLLSGIDIKEPVILTTVKPAGFYRLPMYSTGESNVQTQSTRTVPLEAILSEDQGDWLENLKAWFTARQGKVTDLELSEQYKKMTGQKALEREAIQALRENLLSN